jgi:hypothetical protein
MHSSAKYVWEDEFDTLTDFITHEALNLSGQVPPAKFINETKAATSSHARLADDGAGEKPLWVYGVHAKAGAYLASAIASNQMSSMGIGSCSADTCAWIEKHQRCENFKDRDQARVWYNCHFNTTHLQNARQEARDSGRNLRVVHMIRDPLALVVSSWLYHTQGPKENMPVPEMANMSMPDALAFEARRAFSGQLRDMLELYQDSGSDVMVVRLEDLLRSSESFDNTIKSVYNFAIRDIADRTLVDSLTTAAQANDVRRHPIRQNDRKVSDDELKDQVTQALQNMPLDIVSRLHEYRTNLGYA